MRIPILVTLLPVLAACASSAPVAPRLEARTVHATSNPILSDGTDYTADPAPLVADGKLYIVTGRDTARRFGDFRVSSGRMPPVGSRNPAEVSQPSGPGQ